MPRVQGPPVVLGDEVIGLPGEAHLQGIVVDVNDRATDVVGMIEKDFPTGSAPDGVGVVAEAQSAKPQAAGARRVSQTVTASG